MSVNDRGTKKWTSLMLPEHVEMLKRAFAEENYQEKPLLDEQQKRKMDMLLTSALHENKAVEIIYFQNHRLKKIQGKPLYIDPWNKYLQLERMRIPLADMIDVEII